MKVGVVSRRVAGALATVLVLGTAAVATRAQAQVRPDGWGHAERVAQLTASDGISSDWFGHSVAT